jgi:FAD/FMN-containing dehydrogenase
VPVDNLVSLNLVTAKGDFINVSKSSYPDLFWALAGAGPNFGVVTSFTIKTHAVPDSRAWVSQLLFTGDRLEAYIDAMNNLNLTEKMVNNWGLNYLPPDYQPFITAGLLYHDPNDTAAREAFKPLFDIGPYSETTEILEHNHINDGVDDFCIKGGRKPSWHVGLKVLDYSTWQLVWNDWVQFVQKTNLTGTRVLVETYSNYVAREIGSDDTSYPHRAINFHAVFQSVYVDSKWDRDVEDIGSRVRSAWRSTDGFDAPRTYVIRFPYSCLGHTDIFASYVNFAHGDEAPEDVYGESLPRLQELKAAWDPTNRFSQWLPLM